MAQVLIRSPFCKLELRNQLRPNPSAGFHFFDSQAQSPAAGFGLGQVHKRTLCELYGAEALPQISPRDRRESVASSSHVNEPIAIVKAEYDGIERIAAYCVSADDEIASLVEPHFPPGSRPLA